jgi:hypothetical protein
MIHQGYLIKDGLKWVIKQKQEIIIIKNIKMYIIQCHINKENNLLNKEN